jgi:hypothetical protein
MCTLNQDAKCTKKQINIFLYSNRKLINKSKQILNKIIPQKIQ